jgi:hypothetical protein
VAVFVAAGVDIGVVVCVHKFAGGDGPNPGSAVPSADGTLLCAVWAERGHVRVRGEKRRGRPKQISPGDGYRWGRSRRGAEGI